MVLKFAISLESRGIRCDLALLAPCGVITDNIYAYYNTYYHRILVL